MKTLPLSEAETNLGGLINTPALNKGILLTKNGRPAAVLISPDELESREETFDIRAVKEGKPMRITINDDLGEKIRSLPDPDAFVNSVLEQALAEREKMRKKLEQAASDLLDDYKNDPELTAFTALDSYTDCV